MIADAAREGIGSRTVKLEVDVPELLVWPASTEAIGTLVGALVRGAVDNLGPGGEILVTAWQRGEVLEIEVADNGPALDSRPQRLPMSAAALGAELVWQNCPQGGAAVTAILTRAERLREAA